MASDSALYRRHRPVSFAEIQGQDVLKSVASAVKNGTPHHAYLFTGPRGVGKTTTARLIAAGLNCDTCGPTDTPCGECPSCISISQGNSMDVQEIDAASNNSVENIRDLRNKTAVVAAFGGYRVFILDEVHMLSNSAWNALLKTLEEPPSHTVFVLCTTEPGKVPATVKSRCQHIALKAGTVPQVTAQVKKVAALEEITIDDDAAQLIARAARGSYRDALGYLQGAASDNDNVTQKAVHAILGTEEEMKVFEAVKAIAENDVAKALSAAAYLASDRQAETVLSDLEALMRDILICTVMKKIPDSLKTSTERDELIIRASNALGLQGTARVLDEVANALIAIRAGADPKVRLELALVKAADPKLFPPLEEQMARRMDRLEGAVQSRNYSKRPT